MFGFLKKKLAKAIESISKKAEAKGELAEEVKKPEVKEEIKQAIEGEAELKVDVIPKLETVESQVVVKEEKKGLFKKLAEKVVKKITQKKLTVEDIQPILHDLEIGLIEADVAVEVADKIVDDLRFALVDTEIKRGKEREVVVGALKKSLMEILSIPPLELGERAKAKKPIILVFIGFNGSGKTTSIAKLASWLKKNNFTSVLAAGDTWRAGAEEQLETHAKNIGLIIIKHRYGADPAAVIYDAIEHAKAKGLDFVLADTAGRTHTNRNLMEEMKKIVRVNKPDYKILVIDSLTGNDAVLQARMFNEIGVDAVIFTKVDVNEKGGAILSVTHELKKPILFLGLGQKYENFEKFEPNKFVSNLLD
jgi:fused signal recognition particle receptor